MSDGIMLTIGDDGEATLYDGTYDITIHCESKEEQDEVRKALENIPHWIPVEQDLPKENYLDNGYVEPSQPVLVYMNYHAYKISRYWGHRKSKGTSDYVIPDWMDLEEYDSENVIAWMPLPRILQGGGGMSRELKPCPFRVHGERRESLTVAGEFFYNETFMPCMGKGCACYKEDSVDAYCDRNGAFMLMTKEVTE